MKKIILLVSIIAFSLSSMAQQTDRGRILAGGLLNLTWDDGKETTTYSNGLPTTQNTSPTNLDFTFSPNIGVFLFRNFAMGLKINSEVKNQYQGGGNNFQSNFNVGPFLRYYKKIGPLAPFGELGYGVGSVSNTGNIPTPTHFKGTVLTIGPGAAFFLTEKIGIEGVLLYEYLSSKTDATISGISASTSSKQSRMRFNIGFQVYL